MEANLTSRVKAEAIRGGALLLTGEVDLVGVALAAMRKKLGDCWKNF